MTIHDIARLAGVSHTTVSRVINGHQHVKPLTRQKILALMDEHSYIPNDSARILKLSATKSVGVFSNTIHNPFLSKMVQGLEQGLKKHHYSVYLHIIDAQEDFVLSVRKEIKAKKLGGLIFVGGYSAFYEEAFAGFKVPILFATIKPPLKSTQKWFSSVYIDDRKAAFTATSYLCSLRHSRIAIITSGRGGKSIGQDRLQGYLDALESRGLQADENLIRRIGDSSDIDAAYKATQSLLNDKAAFSAVFAISDMLALGVIRALVDSGMRVPEDVSVLGFDGIELGKYSIPRLSTVSQPVEEMVDASVSTIIGMMDNKSPGSESCFQTTLTLRDSCRENKI